MSEIPTLRPAITQPDPGLFPPDPTATQKQQAALSEVLAQIDSLGMRLLNRRPSELSTVYVHPCFLLAVRQRLHGSPLKVEANPWALTLTTCYLA